MVKHHRRGELVLGKGEVGVGFEPHDEGERSVRFNAAQNSGKGMKSAFLLIFSSLSISATDFPREDFMKPKKALAVTSSSRGGTASGARCQAISVPAPQRFMARGFLRVTAKENLKKLLAGVGTRRATPKAGRSTGGARYVQSVTTGES